MERDAKFGQVRGKRSAGSYGFGSSTPRMTEFEILDQSKRAVSQGSLLRKSGDSSLVDKPSELDSSVLRAQRRAASACNLAARNKSSASHIKHGMTHATA